MQHGLERMEAVGEAEMNKKRLIYIVVYVLSIITCICIVYYSINYKFHARALQSMTLAAMSMSKGEYEDAISYAYGAAGGGFMAFEATEAIGNSYYCLGDKHAAEINYRLALNLTDSRGMQALLKSRIHDLKNDGSGDSNFPKCNQRMK
jgi:hypothetical protein